MNVDGVYMGGVYIMWMVCICGRRIYVFTICQQGLTAVDHSAIYACPL